MGGRCVCGGITSVDNEFTQLVRFYTGENIVRQITKGKREIRYRLRRCLNSRRFGNGG